MIADGLTKGSIDRLALHTLMDGSITYTQEPKCWSSKVHIKAKIEYQ